VGIVAKIYNSLFNNKQVTTYDQIPNRDYLKAIKYPVFKKKIMECSIEEDEENSYYTGILNTIAENCVGSTPLVLGKHPEDEVNDSIEDKWHEWCVNNSIGSAIRQIRRGAARTGLGIGIPYAPKNSPDPVILGIKTLCAIDLKQPWGADPADRIIDGVKYDENWDIETIYVDNGTMEPTPFHAKDIIIWHKSIKEGVRTWAPECGAAFTLFPSVKRFMKAIVRGEEMKSSIPMAIKLDPMVYKPDAADGIPQGQWEYEPGMVPTLPPGTDLTGLQFGSHGTERNQFIQLVIGAAARCVQMPKNIALGDSSGHNMATAAIDIIPWKNRVSIDRTDFEPATRKIFKMWLERAVRVSDYLSVRARGQSNRFTFDLNYDLLFQHPDPMKNANSRAIDLISGSTTLSRVYMDQGLNARRELQREAKLRGVSVEELHEVLLVSRSPQVLSLLQGLPDEAEQ